MAVQTAWSGWNRTSPSSSPQTKPTGRPRRSSPRAALLRIPPLRRARRTCSSASLMVPAGLDWITALRAPAIRALVEAGELQLSLFDRRDMAAITSPDYPGERLIVCRNGELAAERRRKPLDLL